MKKTLLVIVFSLFVLGRLPGPVQACLIDEDCNDGNPCTVDFSTTDGWACDDQDVCTMDDTCMSGVCDGAPLDEDGDTYVSDACNGPDCDDADPLVHPDATEGPDGHATCSDAADNDCDGAADLNDPGCVPCVDEDQDGYGEEASENCTYPEEDCNDANPDINPGVLEGPPATITCADGKDNDCDGLTDKADEFCIGSAVWTPDTAAEASTVGSRSGARSRAANLLAILVVPIGIILSMKAVCRKK
jgi:hypothetical protein